MFRFSKAATLMMRYMAPAGDDGAASGAQDIESRIQAALFPEQQPDDGNADDQDDAVVNGDGKRPPEADDADDGKDAELDGDDVDDDGEITVASLLGIDEDKLEYDADGKVVFNAIIDGQVQKVPMGELVKSYQLQGHVNNKSIALEEERKTFAATKQQASQELLTRLESLNKLTDVAEKQLMADFEGVDWNGLRMTEPGEWAALQQQFQSRLNYINQIKALGGQEGERIKAEQQAEQQAQNQTRIGQELAKMVQDNPAWSDQSVMAKEFGEIGAFLREKYGFADQEVANNLDARLMRLIRDAKQFHSATSNVQTKKAEKPIPKFVKPGVVGDRPSMQKARAVKQQKEQIRKSGGSVDAVAAALIDRM